MNLSFAAGPASDIEKIAREKGMVYPEEIRVNLEEEMKENDH